MSETRQLTMAMEVHVDDVYATGSGNVLLHTLEDLGHHRCTEGRAPWNVSRRRTIQATTKSTRRRFGLAAEPAESLHLT